MNELSNYLGNLQLDNLSGPLNHAEEPPLELDALQATDLSRTFSQSISQDWSMPHATRPLNQAELQFLRSHNVVEIGGRPDTPSNEFERFVQKVVQQAVTQMASDFTKIVVQDALTPQPEPVKAAPAPKKDPSLETMKKIAKHDVEAKVISVGKKLLGDSINVVQHGEFIQHAGKTLGASLAGVHFLEQVTEIGFDAAAAQTAGTITRDFIVKHGVNAAATFVGCTNPLFCANLVITVIKDLFTPTETAPPSMDMYGHIPPMQFPRGSFLPELNPNLGPAFRPAPN